MSFLASNFSRYFDLVSITGFRRNGCVTKFEECLDLALSCGLVLVRPMKSTELDLMILRSDFHLERFCDDDH